MAIELLNIDCMEYMKSVPNKTFDLAIVDPPYGIGNFTQSDRKKKYGDYSWNESTPNEDYFIELDRVSKNRIVWGANYYNCFDGGSAIVWNKKNPHPSMSVCEIASVSFGKRVAYYEMPYYGFVGTSNNIHPCQKPVKLYSWILKNYAEQGYKILDTHLGSGSIAIACHDLGFDLVGCELDKDYYDAAVKRFNNHKLQTKLF